MVSTLNQTITAEDVAELKKTIRRLNTKAGQQKMNLHDLAEGLPTDYQTLLEEASKTYEIYRELEELNQKLKTWEEKLSCQ